MKTIKDLEKEVNKLWNHVLILSCICAFTELCDLIALQKASVEKCLVFSQTYEYAQLC